MYIIIGDSKNSGAFTPKVKWLEVSSSETVSPQISQPISLLELFKRNSLSDFISYNTTKVLNNCVYFDCVSPFFILVIIQTSKFVSLFLISSFH